MKILVLAYYIDNPNERTSGGSGRFMLTVAQTLANMGHEVITSTKPEDHNDKQYDLIICSHFLHRIGKNPAPKICVSHGILADEYIYPGAQKYISISEETKAHNLKKYGMYSTVIGQPIEIRERKKPNDTLQNILVIRRQNPEKDPFAFLAEKYNLKYSDLETPIEDQIEWADICITLGRGALEAMAQGKPVLIADNRDYQGPLGDGYVTAENINEIAKHNFSGRRYRMPLTQEWIESELAKYNPDDSEFLYTYVSENHEATKIMGDYLRMVEHAPDAGQAGLLSIIVPVWNQLEMSHECIQAIIENTEPGTYEIIIIDNGSDPPFAPPISIHEIRVIRNEENKGFPIAMNQGIRDAHGDVIVIFNNDIIVTPRWAERLRWWLDEGFDIIAPMTNYSAGVQGTTIGSYQNKEELEEATEAFSEENEGSCRDVNFCTIGMFVKRKIFDDIGYLDESLWPSCGEDIDFGFRARKAGYRVGVAGDVYVHHEGSKTFEAMQNAGIIDYDKVVTQNDNHLGKKWGSDFWNRQLYYGKIKLLDSDAIRLNLGCGNYPMEDFINIDQSRDVNPDLLIDATDLPYYPNSVDEIYCGHLLEHLTWEEGQRALKHWLSILKPGGEIRVVVPNFDVLAAIYFQTPTPAEMKHLNDYFIYSYVQESLHRYFYSAGLLKEAMETAGFKRVERLPIDHPYFMQVVDWQVGFVGVKP